VSKLAVASLVVSIVAAGFTGLQYTNALDQLEAAETQAQTQQQELDDLRAQFEASGPRLTYTFAVEYNPRAGEQEPPSTEGPVFDPLDEDLFSRYSVVWLRVNIENSGASNTMLQSVQLEIAPDVMVPVRPGEDAQCIIRGGDYRPCNEALPVELTPATHYEVWFPLSRYTGQFDTPAARDGGMVMVVSNTGVIDAPSEVPTGLQITD
jgi:hypothetical protein